MQAPKTYEIGNAWVKFPISGYATLQVKTGKIFYSFGTSEPISATDAFSVGHVANISGVDAVYVKTAAINGETSTVVFGETDDNGSGGAGGISSIDGFKPNDSGALRLAAAAVRIIKSSENATAKPALKTAAEFTYYIHITNGTVTLDLSDWNASTHPRLNIRIITTSNLTGKIELIVPGGVMWRLNGSNGAPETINVTTSFRVYDIVNTVGSGPAIVQVYPGRQATTE